MWLSDLKIAQPDGILENGSLRIEDGKIAEIIAGQPSDTTETNLLLPGMMAIPGIIDLHGDMLERDIQPRPGADFPVTLGLFELDKRLAATGITTAYAAVAFAWREHDLRKQDKALEIIDTIHEQRSHLLVDMRTHARFEVSNATTETLLLDLIAENKLHLVSLMDHTPGQGQYSDVAEYINFMSRWLGFDPDKVGRNAVEKVTDAVAQTAETAYDWSLCARLTQIAREHGLPVASHDDDTIEKVNKMHDLGVTISEFPINLEAARAAQAHGMHIIMGAPNAYRGKSSGGNLSALDGIKAGVVNSLATDYFPAAPLHAAFRIAELGILPLHESIKLVTQNPADAVNLTERGRLQVGCLADIVLIDQDEYDHPRVHGTLRDGHFIYQDAFILRRILTIDGDNDYV